MRGLGLSIPLYDEEECCERVVTELLDALREARIHCSLALVNNGSQDETGAIINRLSARHDACTAIHLSENAGYGGGILVGLRSLETPVLGWIWGDAQVPPEVVVRAARRLAEGDVDLVKARRDERQDGWQRLVITKTYNATMRLGFGLESADVNGCPKLMTRAAYEALDLRSTDWFLDPELMLKAHDLGLRMAEVEAVMLPRPGGVSKVKAATVREFLRNLAAWKRGHRPE